MLIDTYGKSLVAALYAIAATIIPLVDDGHVDPAEGVSIAIAVVTAASVYVVPLAPGSRWAKSVAALLLAGLNVAATVILDGHLDATEMLMIVAAALGAIGVTLAPAASPATGTAVGWGSDS